MTKRILLFALVLMAATNEACAANGTAWSSLGSKKSKIAPQPTPLTEAIMKESESAKTASIRSGGSVAPELLKKTPSQDSTDSNITEQSDVDKRKQTRETIRYFQDIADEIVESHYVPKVKKGKSLPWLTPQEERSMTAKYNQCSRSSVANRLMRCTNECIANAHELFSSQGRVAELQELCIKRCTNSGKLFIAETAEQIENYNVKQQRR